jgi:serine/threonine protein kinase
MGICCCKRSSSTALEKVSNINKPEIPKKNIEKKMSQNFKSIGENILEENKESKVTLQDFLKLKVLGRGAFGKVILVKFLKTNELYALKVLKKKIIIKRKQIDHTKTERYVLEKLNHPFIVKLHFAFQDEKKLYLVTEFMQGGELFFHLLHNSKYKEKDVRFYMSEILLAIEYMHSQNLIYRDLKPENILIAKDGHIKLADFGLSKLLTEPSEKTYTICGTPEYLAPEIILEKGYDKTCDWFSFGVIIFEMFCGYHPYKHNKGKINKDLYSSPLKIPEYVPKFAKDLILKLTVTNPKKRLGFNGANEVKSHAFFSEVDFDKVIDKKVKPPFIPKIRDDMDLKYFDKEFTTEKIETFDNNKMSLFNNNELFDGFSYSTKENL